jgi:RNA polymerase sigma-70 factor (ECF subfamily)
VARPSDEELVLRLRRGDEWAKEALYRRYFEAVWGTSLRLLGNRADAEDVVQDTFATALEQIGALRDSSALAGWLVQIAVRLVHRRFRRRKLLRALGLDRGAEDSTLELLAQPGATPELQVELRWLDRALGELATKQRIAWMLRHVEGHSLEEVAEICDASLASVKRYIAAADAHVRRHVEFSAEVSDG